MPALACSRTNVAALRLGCRDGSLTAPWRVKWRVLIGGRPEEPAAAAVPGMYVNKRGCRCSLPWLLLLLVLVVVLVVMVLRSVVACCSAAVSSVLPQS